MADTAVVVLAADGPRVLDPESPVLRADDLGVLRGESVFETLRIAAGRAAFVDAHVRRLARSAERLAIELPTGWEALVDCAVRAYGEQDGVLRLICSKGPPGGSPAAFATASAVPAETVHARQHGVRAITLTVAASVELRARSPWLLGGVKSTSYAVNMACLRQAHDEGVDEAIWVSADGEVLEAPTSTVAWVTAGRLITPPADEVAILPGTTVETVLRLCQEPWEVRRGTVDELRAADEVLLLSSVRGVAPVTELDGRVLGTGPVTTALRDAFEAELLR